MQSKLILFEGIPGSGKSTAAGTLQNFLEGNNVPSRSWREGDFDHPADFEGVACLTESQYQDLLSCRPELTELFQEHTSISGTDYLLKYRKLQHLHPQKMDQALMDTLASLDVSDGLPMDEYCRLALVRWRSFCETARDSNEVTLLECCFLQNPLTVLLARHNVDPRVARQQVRKISEIIHELNPLVIYLQPRNTSAALQYICAERPKEWTDFVIWYLTKQEYGKSHGIEGYEGVIHFYEMRQKMELDILRSLPIQQLVIEHSGKEWERCNTEIVGFISLIFLG
jgi:hypothetical protein